MFQDQALHVNRSSSIRPNRSAFRAIRRSAPWLIGLFFISTSTILAGATLREHRDSRIAIAYVTVQTSNENDATDDKADADVHVKSGTEFLQRGDLVHAVEEYREALRIKPDYAEVYVALSAGLFNLKKYEEAIDACRESIRLMPNWDQPHFSMAASLLMLQRLPEAEAEFR